MGERDENMITKSKLLPGMKLIFSRRGAPSVFYDLPSDQWIIEWARKKVTICRDGCVVIDNAHEDIGGRR